MPRSEKRHLLGSTISISQIFVFVIVLNNADEQDEINVISIDSRNTSLIWSLMTTKTYLSMIYFFLKF